MHKYRRPEWNTWLPSYDKIRPCRLCERRTSPRLPSTQQSRGEMMFVPQQKTTKVLQGGPLPAINGVVTPIGQVIRPFIEGYNSICN